MNFGAIKRKSTITLSVFICVALIYSGRVPAVAGDAPKNAPAHERFIWGYEKAQDFLDPMGLDYDEAGKRVYVADTGNGRICVFTQDGMPVDEYASYRDQENKLVKFLAPIDVAVDAYGSIFVSDQQLGKVIAMDFRGNEIFTLDTAKAEPEAITLGRVVIDKNNNLFVGDTTNNQVLVFDAEGNFKHKFGKVEGAKTSRIEQVNDIYPAPGQDRIFVTSKAGTAFHIFNYDGAWLTGLGAHENGSMNYSYPSGIVSLPDGSLFVADTLRSEVKMYGSALDHLGNFGGLGSGPSAIIYPVDMDIDAEGFLYIMEKTPRRVHIFRLAGAGG